MALLRRLCLLLLAVLPVLLLIGLRLDLAAFLRVADGCAARSQTTAD